MTFRITATYTGSVLALGLICAMSQADEAKKTRYPKPPSAAGVNLVPEAWKSAPVQPLSSAELDALLAEKQREDKVTPTKPATDEQFIRRLYLDLVGKLPSAKEIREFVDNPDSHKRSQLIDKLLDSDDFARHRARFWRDVIQSRATAMMVFVVVPRQRALEVWLFEQFKAKRSWSAISRDLIQAEGDLMIQEPLKNGQTGFLLCHIQMDGPVERTNDTARVFLGINLQCAQCHDHPDDIWKRNQFHEMTAFFGRTGERIRNRSATMMGLDFVVSLGGRPFGEYSMPSQDDPKQTTVMHPRFLTGEEPGKGLSDKARREALANYVTSKENYYFAAAFVNRLWGELIGQPFVQPVDNLGPLQPAIYSDVLVRLSASFRASDHDIRALYRTILNSQAYQRQLRMGETPREHMHFSGTYPTRLRPDAQWEALVCAVGFVPGFAMIPGAPRRGPGGRVPPLREIFRDLFDFDPSINPDEVEATVPQALMLMNNEVINNRMKATGDTSLARLLKEHSDDAEAIQKLYLQALGRKPTDREVQVCRTHIQKIGDRNTAFEDLLWTLVNSTEFRTRR